MKKYPKLVQCDQRGQLVIPKDIRLALSIEAGTGFWVYSIGDEGILLKKVEPEELDDASPIIEELEDKADRIKLKKKSIKKATDDYRRTSEGNLEVVE